MATDSLSLPRLDISPPLSRQTYEIILNAILSFEFRPGDRLSVQWLSEQLGVSRTPVKEALQRLEQEGLVTVVARTGTFVSPIEVKDIDEILEARALVEAFAAARAARELSRAELGEAENALENMARALEEDRIARCAELGHGLHLIILTKLANDRLEGFLKQMDLQYTRVRRIFSHKASRQQQSLDEHYGILKRLKDHDSAAAFSAMYDHHLSVRDDLVVAWRATAGEKGYPEELIDRIEFGDD